MGYILFHKSSHACIATTNVRLANLDRAVQPKIFIVCINGVLYAFYEGSKKWKKIQPS